MDPLKWEKIKKIFEISLNLPETEKEDYITESAEGDEEIISEVRSLIHSIKTAGDFLDNPGINLNEQKDSFIGRKLGPYLVEKVIAAGGMGIVYLAVRDDAEFKKQVAVKLIRSGLNNKYLTERFKTEKQTLAYLDHPYIAKLLDAGSTDDGTPYLIMDYIDGEPIDVYCDKNRLTLSERLELFSKVCSAVHYAHQNLVVHRDIKPSNIMVTEKGEPKLLDFGIAKILSSDSPDAGRDLTKTGYWQLTPEYASPEQVKGENIATTSDVYSLGILLYKILTGHNPYRFKSYLPTEIHKVVCFEEPQKPSIKVESSEELIKQDGSVKEINAETVSNSRGTSIEHLKRKLKGDIDNIILKAIRKEPWRRYGSVEQFSEDIKRYSDGLPVIARNDTMGYLLSKFIKRHKTGVAMSAISVLLLIAGILGIAWQASIAAKERDKAKLEASKSERINTFMQDIFAAPNPEVEGKDVKVVDVLKNASEKIDKELSDDPDIKVSVLYTIGTTYIGLGLYDDAEKYLKNSLAVCEKNFSLNDPQTAKVMEQLAYDYQLKSNYSKADSLYKEALKIFRVNGGEISSDEATALSDFGSSLYNQGKYDESKKYQTEALNAYRKIYGDTDARVVRSLSNLGTVAGETGDWNTASQYIKEVLEIFLKTDGKESVNYSRALSNYATTLEVQGNLDDAITAQREAVEIKKRVQGKDHPDAMLAQLNLADELTKRGDFKESAELSREAMESLDKSLPHINALTAYSRVIYAKALIKLENFKKALPFINEALKIREKLYSPDHWLITTTRALLGVCLVGIKQYSRAEQILTNCYSKMDKNDEGKKYFRVLTLENLVKIYEATGNKKAEQKCRVDLDKENHS